MSHFNQRIAVHSKDEVLMCKVYPSSLGPMAMRWFDGLKTDSIGSFNELTLTFGSRLVTCSRVPQPLDSLLSLSMREGETLKTYSNKYWEMFNEIDGEFDDVAISTFKVGLSIEHGLMKSRLATLSLVCASSWTRLISTRRLRKTSIRGKERLRLSLRRGGISGWTDTTTIDL